MILKLISDGGTFFSKNSSDSWFFDCLEIRYKSQLESHANKREEFPITSYLDTVLNLYEASLFVLMAWCSKGNERAVLLGFAAIKVLQALFDDQFYESAFGKYSPLIHGVETAAVLPNMISIRSGGLYLLGKGVQCGIESNPDMVKAPLSALSTFIDRCPLSSKTKVRMRTWIDATVEKMTPSFQKVVMGYSLRTFSTMMMTYNVMDTFFKTPSKPHVFIKLPKASSFEKGKSQDITVYVTPNSIPLGDTLETFDALVTQSSIQKFTFSVADMTGPVSDHIKDLMLRAQSPLTLLFPDPASITILHENCLTQVPSTYFQTPMEFNCSLLDDQFYPDDRSHLFYGVDASLSRVGSCFLLGAIHPFLMVQSLLESSFVEAGGLRGSESTESATTTVNGLAYMAFGLGSSFYWRHSKAPFIKKVESTLFSGIAMTLILGIKNYFSLSDMMETSLETTDHVTSSLSSTDSMYNAHHRFNLDVCSRSSSVHLKRFCSSNHFAAFFAPTLIKNSHFEGASESYYLWEQFLFGLLSHPNSTEFQTAKQLYDSDFSLSNVSFEDHLSQTQWAFSRVKAYTAYLNEISHASPPFSIRGVFDTTEITKFNDDISKDVLDAIKDKLVETRGLMIAADNTHYFPSVDSIEQDLIDVLKDRKLNDRFREALDHHIVMLRTHFKENDIFIKLIECIKQDFQQLKMGQSLIIPSGWSGDSNHAAVCVLRKQDKFLELIIGNKGDRMNYPKAEPRIQINGITELYETRVFHVPKNKEAWVFSILKDLIRAKIPHKSRTAFSMYNLLNSNEMLSLEQRTQNSIGLGAMSGTCHKDAPELGFDLLTKKSAYTSYLHMVFNVHYLASFLDTIDPYEKKQTIPIEMIRNAEKTLLRHYKDLKESGLDSDELTQSILKLSKQSQSLVTLFSDNKRQSLETLNVGVYEEPQSIVGSSYIFSRLESVVHDLRIHASQKRDVANLFKEKEDPIVGDGKMTSIWTLNYDRPLDGINSIDELCLCFSDYMAAFKDGDTNVYDSILDDPKMELSSRVVLPTFLDMMHDINLRETLKNVNFNQHQFNQLMKMSRFLLLEIERSSYSDEASVPVAVALTKLWLMLESNLIQQGILKNTKFELQGLNGLSFKECIENYPFLGLEMYQGINDILDIESKRQSNSIASLLSLDINQDEIVRFTKQNLDKYPNAYPLLMFMYKADPSLADSDMSRFKLLSTFLDPTETIENQNFKNLKSLFHLGVTLRSLFSSPTLNDFKTRLKSHSVATVSSSADTLSVKMGSPYLESLKFDLYVTPKTSLDSLLGSEQSIENAAILNNYPFTLKTDILPNDVTRDFYSIFQEGLTLVHVLSFVKQHPFYANHPHIFNDIKRELTRPIVGGQLVINELTKNILTLSDSATFISEFFDELLEDLNRLEDIKLANRVTDLYLLIHDSFSFIKRNFQHQWQGKQEQQIASVGDAIFNQLDTVAFNTLDVEKEPSFKTIEELKIMLQEVIGQKESFLSDVIDFYSLALPKGVNRFSPSIKTIEFYRTMIKTMNPSLINIVEKKANKQRIPIAPNQWIYKDLSLKNDNIIVTFFPQFNLLRGGELIKINDWYFSGLPKNHPVRDVIIPFNEKNTYGVLDNGISFRTGQDGFGHESLYTLSEPYIFRGKEYNSFCAPSATMLVGAQILSNYKLESLNLRQRLFFSLEKDTYCVLCISNITQRPVYETIVTHNEEHVFVLDDNGVRTDEVFLAEVLTTHPMMKRFLKQQRLDDVSHYDDYKLTQSIHSKEFTLSSEAMGYTFKITDESITCNGHSVASDQSLPGFGLFPDYDMALTQYVVLENKLLLPSGYPVESTSFPFFKRWEDPGLEKNYIKFLDKNPFKNQKMSDLKSHQMTVPHFMYPIDPITKEIVADTQEKALHLALIYQTLFNFEKANSLLESFTFQTPLSTNGKALFAIHNSRGFGYKNTPNDVAMMLKFIFLERESTRFESDPSDTIYDEWMIKESVSMYLKAVAQDAVDFECMLSAYQFHVLFQSFPAMFKDYTYNALKQLVSQPSTWIHGKWAKVDITLPHLDPVIKTPFRELESLALNTATIALDEWPTESLYASFFETQKQMYPHYERESFNLKETNLILDRMRNEKEERLNAFHGQHLVTHRLKVDTTSTIIISKIKQSRDDLLQLKTMLFSTIEAYMAHSDESSMASRSGSEPHGTFEDLLFAFIKQDATLYRYCIAGISLADIDDLDTVILNYLDVHNSYTFINSILEDNDRAPLSIQTLATRLYEKRNYPSEFRAALLYGYLTGINPRRSQIDIATVMSILEQRIQLVATGSGKSRIIAPLVALTHSNSTATGLIVPSNLVSSMVSLLRSDFRPIGYPVFDLLIQRDLKKLTSFSEKVRHAMSLRDHLAYIQATRGMVVIPSESVLSLVAKIAELTDMSMKRSDGFNYGRLLELYIESYTIINSFSMITDEYQKVTSLKDSFTYSYGLSQPVDDAYFETTAEILKDWLHDDTIRHLIRTAPEGVFETKRLSSVKEYTLLLEKESLYFKKTLIPALIGLALTRFEQHYPYLFVEISKPALTLYLSGGRKNKEENEQLEQSIQNLDSSLANKIVQSKSMILDYLPFVLSKEPDTDFGPDHYPPLLTNQIVRPRSSGHSKGPSTLFEEPSVTIAATIYFYTLKGIPKNVVKQYLVHTLNEALTSFEETPRVTLSSLLGISPSQLSALEITDNFVDLHYDDFKYNEVLIAAISQKIIHDELRVYPEKIEVSAFSALSQLGQLRNGMTATETASELYPPDYHVDKDPLLGIGELLLRDPHNNKIEILQRTDIPFLYENLIRAYNNGFNGYLDGANYFSDDATTVISNWITHIKETNHKVDIDGIAYVLETGERVIQWVGERGYEPFSQEKVTEKNVFYFFKLKDGIGIDFSVSRLIISVGIESSTLLRQHDGRNRALYNSFYTLLYKQHPNLPENKWWISEALMPAVATVLDCDSSEIKTKEAIMQWKEYTTAQHDKVTYMIGFQSRMNTIVHNAAMMVLTDLSQSSEKRTVAASFFIKKNALSPLEKNGRLSIDLPKRTVFEDYSRNLLHRFGAILTTEDKKRIHTLCDEASNYEGFDAMLAHPSMQLDSSVTTEVSISTDQQTDIDHVEKNELESAVYKEKDWDMSPLLIRGDTSMLVSISDQLNKTITFPYPFYVSEEFLKTHTAQCRLSKEEQRRFPGRVSKKIEQVAVIQKENSDILVVALTQKEAISFLNFKEESTSSISLFSLAFTTALKCSETGLTQLPENVSHKLNQMILFLNAEYDALATDMKNGSHLKIEDTSKAEKLMSELGDSHNRKHSFSSMAFICYKSKVIQKEDG